MSEMLWAPLGDALGYNRDVADVNALQMALRTAAIYAGTLFLIRIGSKRFLGQASAFDIVVAIMLGSVMSRAINGSAPLVATLASGAAFVALHWLLTTASRTSRFGALVKGNPVLLIEDGDVKQPEMRRTGLSERDLEQALRVNGQTTDVADVKLAYLERNGDVSVIRRPSELRIVEISVGENVQTVRLELS
jgi:uncharacterized membrane protein YcaP (DUF421 family)